MRTPLLPACILGLVALVACSNAVDDDGTAGEGAAAAAPADGPGAEANAPSAEPGARPSDEAGTPSGEDAAAPAPTPSDADAGTDGGGQQTIPLASKGKIYVSTNVWDPCAWTVDGASFGTRESLELTLFAGDHAVTCTRAADGASNAKTLTVLAGKTTNASFGLPSRDGKLTLVALGATCTFTINGAFKGSGDELLLMLPSGYYTVGCKPSTGEATVSKSVKVWPDGNPMAMFDFR